MKLDLKACVEHRAEVTTQELMKVGAIPVLTLGVTADTHNLVIIGYNSKTSNEIAEILKDYLASVETAKNITVS